MIFPDLQQRKLYLINIVLDAQQRKCDIELIDSELRRAAMYSDNATFRTYLASQYRSWLSFQQYLELLAANKINK